MAVERQKQYFGSMSVAEELTAAGVDSVSVTKGPDGGSGGLPTRLFDSSEFDMYETLGTWIAKGTLPNGEEACIPARSKSI